MTFKDLTYEELAKTKQVGISKEDFENQKAVEELERELGDTDLIHSRPSGAVTTGSFTSDPGDYDQAEDDELEE